MKYTHPTMAQTLMISLVGFLTVFLVLVVLMLLIWLMSKIVQTASHASKPGPVTAAPETTEAADLYTGVHLENVSDREAAMIMAITADELQKPLDNLRFISIKGQEEEK